MIFNEKKLKNAIFKIYLCKLNKYSIISIFISIFIINLCYGEWTNTAPGGWNRGITVDSTGMVYVTGDYYTANQNYRIIKYNPSGQAVWTKYFDSGVDDESTAVTCDINGNIYITGFIKSLTAGIFFFLTLIVITSPSFE